MLNLEEEISCKGNLDLASLNHVRIGWTGSFNMWQGKKAREEVEKDLSHWQNAQTSLAFSQQWSRVCFRYSSCLMLSVVIM